MIQQANTHGTFREFEWAFRKALEHENYQEAASLVIGNRHGFQGCGLGPSLFWVDWARDVIAGRVRPGVEKQELGEPLRDGDLFGEPITTGKPLKRQKAGAQP